MKWWSLTSLLCEMYVGDEVSWHVLVLLDGVGMLSLWASVAMCFFCLAMSLLFERWRRPADVVYSSSIGIGACGSVFKTVQDRF